MSSVHVPPDAMQPLAASQHSSPVLGFLNTRRSTPLALLGAPGPAPSQLDLILRLASRVPDHRRLVPWRFIVFTDAAKQEAAQQIGARFAELNERASADEVATEVRKFACSPIVVALVSTPDKAHKTPVWEQELSVGAVGQNLLLAANASGFAGVWLSYWYAVDPKICEAFGLCVTERIAGFFHLGTASENPIERPRPDMQKIVKYWQPALHDDAI